MWWLIDLTTCSPWTLTFNNILLLLIINWLLLSWWLGTLLNSRSLRLKFKQKFSYFIYILTLIYSHKVVPNISITGAIKYFQMLKRLTKPRSLVFRVLVTNWTPNMYVAWCEEFYLFSNPRLKHNWACLPHRWFTFLGNNFKKIIKFSARNASAERKCKIEWLTKIEKWK